TKVWNSDQGYESTLNAFETSRKKLGLDYVDLYLVHWAVQDHYLDTWRALEKLYRDGYVRAIGVCNFEPHHLQDVMNRFEIKPMVNQVEFHPFLTQQHIYDFCQANGIQMEAWSPLMRGGEVLNHPLLQELSHKYGKTPAQVILRWDLDKGLVTIPKSVNENRIRENADLFDFKLDAEDIAKLNGLNQNKRSLDYDPNNINKKR
ncbi:MAG: aldo/keto reductase, partial [Tumebacillaceae bacterium]